MADEDQDDKDRLEERAVRQTERRDQMAVHGLRALLILNGGGAVALLAFLQAIWDKPTAAGLVPWILSGIIPLLFGAAASGWVHFVRSDASMAYQMKDRAHLREPLTRRHRGLTSFGYSAFIAGMLIVILGAFMNLPGSSSPKASAQPMHSEGSA